MLWPILAVALALIVWPPSAAAQRYGEWQTFGNGKLFYRYARHNWAECAFLMAKCSYEADGALGYEGRVYYWDGSNGWVACSKELHRPVTRTLRAGNYKSFTARCFPVDDDNYVILKGTDGTQQTEVKSRVLDNKKRSGYPIADALWWAVCHERFL